ncbi:MAG: helicase-related protein [Paludibaculum sp.]
MYRQITAGRIMASPLEHGDIVVRRNKRDERGTIRGSAQRLAGRNYYRVLFPSSPNPVQVSEADLEKVVLDMSIEERLLSGDFGNKSTFSRLITYERLRRPLQETLYSLRASRTDFQAYQFKPLLKFLRSAKQRLLLADEVGLGKTIEAGFILCEMQARHPSSFRRVLIVCKASLCLKWQMEMKKRFELHFELWRAEQLREFLRRYREDEDPAFQAICSLESFRNSTVTQEWEAMPPPLDALIIDEAHHLKNSETKAHKACRMAAESADAVLALTATPIQIGSRDLFNLLSLLDEEEFASYQYFEACMLFNRNIVQAEQRITQADPERFAVVRGILESLGNPIGPLAETALRETGLSSSRLELLEGWMAVCLALRQHPLYAETLRLLSESDPSNRRATVEIQRNLTELNFLSRVFSRTRRRDVHLGTVRTASVVTVLMTEAERGFYRAVVEFVRARYSSEGKDLALLFGLMMPQRQLASCIPAMVEYYEAQVGAAERAGGLDDEESDLEGEDWNHLAEDAHTDRGKELRDLIRMWYREGQPDSKFDALRESLEHLQTSQPGEQVVIFSYFKKTLEYLSRRLGALGYSNTVISGSFTPAEREHRIRQFREGRYQILLSSEVGSEGLDFQFCHLLFNYDLPWNPMVVEQRIGRLDRFGQTAERILIFNLSAPGTIEDEILNRLYRRINLFESYIGDLEAILGGEVTSLTRDLFNPDLTDQQRADKIEQTGLLLEKRKIQFEEWERSSPQFIGHDEYYRQEVDRAQALGRFIRGDDLLVFVQDFLAQFDRASQLVAQGAGVYRVDAGEKLLQFIINTSEDAQKTEFCRRMHLKSLDITFDSEVAERDQNAIFIHVRHFFVRAILASYRSGAAHFHPVAAVQLKRSDSLPAGDYLYLLSRATIRSAREQDALFPVIVDLQTLETVDEEIAEHCLSRMVAEGSDAPPAAIDTERLQCAFTIAESTMAERFHARREDVERLNQAFVDARLSSVRESYRLKIQRKNALLDNARAKKQQLSYIRMLEGGIRNLSAERDLREQTIERLRDVTAEHILTAAGLLHVCEG